MPALGGMAVAKYCSAGKAAGISMTGASVAADPLKMRGASVAFGPQAETNRSRNSKPERANRLANILFSFLNVGTKINKERQTASCGSTGIISSHHRHSIPWAGFPIDLICLLEG